MTILRKIKRALRGDVPAHTLVLEALRRGRVTAKQRRERTLLAEIERRPARLAPQFAYTFPETLLSHFQDRRAPRFFPGFSQSHAQLAEAQRQHFPKETTDLIARAERIATEHSWPLLGLGEKHFGAEIDWHRDPLSNAQWPLDYHAGINLFRGDGSDARVLWELNRLGHLVTLARAYAVTSDERFAVEFFQQIESWRAQNPYGRGANWTCAMEVALRAMNLLAAFEIFRHSPGFDENKLANLLGLFDQHGEFIRNNLEFSFVATSNHYLSDVVGLLWLGIMLPELKAAEAWRKFGLREMLREMDKQVLADGADFESSTGYHRLVVELFLYSFILCRENKINIDARYWDKLRLMLEYTRGYLRPDGRAPLVGDSDSGQVLPVSLRSADEHAHVLQIGAIVFAEPRFKLSAEFSEELLWLLGEEGLAEYQKHTRNEMATSIAFPNAGTYIQRNRDLYLLFNTSDAGVNGRGSHAHNDALSIEVAALGRTFIVDPGTYVYSADLRARHLFRSTAYHSTIQIDGAEQNTITEHLPFVRGDEAQPRVLRWETNRERDLVSAEHKGYERLPQAVTHRRTVILHKTDRWWFIEDQLVGTGEHSVAIRFHFDAGLEVTAQDGSVTARDRTTGTRLIVSALDLTAKADLESQFVSRDYGRRVSSSAACWLLKTTVPCKFRWAIVPLSPGDDQEERLRLITSRGMS